MTDERVAWLHAQIDDDERWALAAKGVRWQWVYNENDQVVNPDPVTQEFLSVTDSDGSEIVTRMDLRSVEEVESAVGTLPAAWPLHGAEEVDPSAAGHIIRHDPARTLRRVAAHRRILDLHDRDHECSVYDRAGEIDNCAWVLKGTPCSTVILLAEEHANRPGYPEMWGQQ